MSCILSVYSINAFKEFLLPAINNADSSVIVSKTVFALMYDVEIPLEIIDRKWYLRENDDFSIIYTSTKERYDGKPLCNKDLLTINLPDGQILNMIVKEVENSFIVYKKYDISHMSAIHIGKSEGADICFDCLNLISREHGIIQKNGDNYVITDTSTNGIFVNYRRIAGSWQLTFGDCIDIFGLRIVYLGNAIAINCGLTDLQINEKSFSEYVFATANAMNIENGKVEPIIFHRSPRKICKIETDVVEIEAPPQAKEKDRQPLAMIIGPSLTMALPMLLGCSLAIYSTRASGGSSSAFMYTGLVTAISSALIGTVWSLVNVRQNRKRNKEEELHRFEVYSEYLVKCAEQVKSKYEKNIASMKEMYLPAETCCNYTADTSILWNRNLSHTDVLFERLGIGNIDFQVEVSIPRDRLTMINDSLAEKPKMIRDSYRILHDVPVGVDLLKHKLVGIFGGEKKKGAIAVAYNLIAQITTNNCYTDVKLVFIYDEKNYDSKDTWGFVKWFPHVWSEDKKTRFVAKNKSEASDVLYEVTKVLRFRQEETQNYSANQRERIPKPYYVLFVADPKLLEDEMIATYIFKPKEEYGISTLLLEENYEQLENACEYLIQCDDTFSGEYSVKDDIEERQAILFDLTTTQAMEKLARNLCNIEVNEIEMGGEIPNTLSFFEMYGINRLEDLNVMERWKKSRTYDSMKALIGQKSGGTDCYLDVHEKYHGPHGLVAGTTGSGKSETLQTYMLSLAINFSPDDVGFFVIDYKGGGMANLFSGLPHMIGQISNLSGNQVRRAMVSIKSENVRRQRIFNEHGVNNINLYTKLYKNNEASIPVPHMFIVIDEFAELKREEPDFMRELISVAQVGRSLGVHLILATQKPSGTVDDNIWSNSKFKLCLRVQDRQDSNDMLHKPDAAYITQAGRCYLQVGNDELYELFQSGYSGATYDASTDSIKTDIAKMISDTGKAALIGSRAKIKQKTQRKREWIAFLINQLLQAADNVQLVLKDHFTDIIARDRIIKELFHLLEEQKVEYPASDYNVRRMEDLIQIYSSIVGAETEPVDYNLTAQAVIDLAAKTGSKLPEMKEKTQLDAVVEYLGELARENGYVHNLQLWLPVLPTELYLDELEGYEQAYQNHTWSRKTGRWDLSIYMGLCDDPVNQAQMPLVLNLSNNGHHAICGTVVSGKSTFLQTLVYSLICKYSPEDINIYGLDYGSKMLAAYEQAPHIGGIVYENENDKLAKFITMISGMLSERKELFKGGNYSQYVQAHGVVVPAIIIVIDNFGNLRSKTESKYDDFFIQLAKDGVGYGIFIVATAGGFGALEIPNRIGDNFRTVLSLEMGDKFQYADVMRTLRVEIMPEENVKGRGLVKMGEALLEYQTALSVRAEDDFKRSEKIALLCEDMKANWKGKSAKRIPEIPANFIWSEFEKTDEVQRMFASKKKLPIGYDARTVAVYGIDLRKTYCYLICGQSRSGKTNMEKVLIQSALHLGGKSIVIDYSQELQSIAEQSRAKYIDDDHKLFTFIKDELIPDFKRRNEKKRNWMAESLSDEIIYEKMQEEPPMFIFIQDMPAFIKHIQTPDSNIAPMNITIENLFEKGSIHNIYWFGCLKLEESVNVSGIRAFEIFARYKTGIHFGGNVSGHHYLDFSHIPFMEQSKKEKPGVALLPMSDDETTRKVILPAAKG